MAENLPEPKSRKESYLAKAAGMDVTVPEAPESREEQYLAAIAEGGGGGGTTYTAGDGIVIENDEISADLTQTTGESTTKLMSQKAITDALASAGGVKELTSADYNYPTNNPDRVALWLLPNGLYRIPTSGVSVYYASNSVWTANHGDFVIVEKTQTGVKPIVMYFFGNTDGVEYCEVSTSGNLNRALAYTILSDRVSQSTGNDQYSVMSQNAATSMVYADPSTKYRVRIGDSASAGGTSSVALGRQSNANNRSVSIGPFAKEPGTGTSVGTVNIGYCANEGNIINAPYSVAIGAGSKATVQGEFNIGTGGNSELITSGYNNTEYRLLTGLYDAQNAHDAVTLGQLNTRLGNLTITTISQSDYNNLQTKDPNTLYLITGA